MLPLAFSVRAAQPTVTLPCVEFALGPSSQGAGSRKAVLVEEAAAGFTAISNADSVAEVVPSL
jgi:hypothetical protein